jgi:UDP-galactopyranose mutase
LNILRKKNDYYIVIFTGPIDSYFSDLEKLEYRSIDFNIEVIKNMKYYQLNSVVNYPEKDVPYTRIVEYKHFLNQKSNDTIIVSEKQMILENLIILFQIKKTWIYMKNIKFLQKKKNIKMYFLLVDWQIINILIWIKQY